MSRGRPRKFDPSIPAHIDQRKLPQGAYWDRADRCWYTKIGRTRRTLAPRTATLADLHARLEALTRVDRSALGYVLDQFHESPQFEALAAATRRDYAWCREILRTYRTGVGMLTAIPVARLSTAAFQAVVDRLASAGTPAKANHVLRYARRALAWGVRRGLCAMNPARGVEQAAERRAFHMPELDQLSAAITFAQDRGARAAHTAGSCPGYLWAFLVLAYRCRLRSIEVLTLTDAQILPDGIRTQRRKGSRDNVVAWAPDLRQAIDHLQARRAEIWAASSRPTPIRPEDRPLIVGQGGGQVSTSTFQSAWRRFIAAARAEGAVTGRISPHGLKHRGITDSADKASGGHRTEAMRQRYNHEVPVVKPAGE